MDDGSKRGGFTGETSYPPPTTSYKPPYKPPTDPDEHPHGNHNDNGKDDEIVSPTIPSAHENMGQELSDIQLIGQAFTFGLIEATILLPADIALVEATVAAGGACLDGILIMCVAEIPIGVLDVVIVDFQVSLGSTIVQNVATGTSHEFEWIITPKILSVFRE